MLSNEEKKRKKKLLNDLKFYLENYKLLFKIEHLQMLKF